MPTKVSSHKSAVLETFKESRGQKPVLRGLHHQRAMRGVVGAVITAGTAAILFHIFWKMKRKSVYTDFYRTYNADASFERMVQAGVFQSVCDVKNKKKWF